MAFPYRVAKTDIFMQVSLFDMLREDRSSWHIRGCLLTELQHGQGSALFHLSLVAVDLPVSRARLFSRKQAYISGNFHL